MRRAGKGERREGGEGGEGKVGGMRMCGRDGEKMGRGG